MPEQEKADVFGKKALSHVSDELIAMLKKARSDEEAAALLMASGVDAPQAEWLWNEFSDCWAYTGGRGPKTVEDAENGGSHDGGKG